MNFQFAGKTSRGAALGVVFLLVCGCLHAQLPSLPGGPQTAPKQPLPDGAVRVISESGRVSWVRSGGDLWALVEGEVVLPNHEIVADSDGHALLELSDGSRVQVFPNSRLTFRAVRGTWKDLLDLALGKVRIHIEKIGGLPNLYKMYSPTAIIAVRGTTFDVVVEPSGTTTVSVEEGLVGVRHLKLSGEEVDVPPGQSLTIYANEPLAQSKKADKIRAITKVGAQVAERVVEVLRQVDATKIPTGTSTTASTATTPTATVGTGSASGSGTGTPPSNGRGSGSGNNGDTGSGTPGSGSTGSGSTGSGSTGGSGSGSSGGSSGTPGTGAASTGPATQSRKP